MKDSRPVIGITMGDPAGIGPEITVKALASEEIYQNCCPVVVRRCLYSGACPGYCWN